MDKHYGWQEGRRPQPQGRQQNGQRWNERYREDDRDMRSARGGDDGGEWEQDDRRWTAAGRDLDREHFMSEDEEYGGQRSFGSRGQSRWDQGGSYRGQPGQFGGGQFSGERARNVGNAGYGNQSFSGGHYGGFANEGFPGQGNYGGNRGFSNQGYSGQRFSQGTRGQGRDAAGQSSWNQGDWGQGASQTWGQTFGQGYQGSQSYRGQTSGGRHQGRGFAGRGPKGYQRSDDRIKEQVSDRLMDDDDIDATEITIEVRNGEVTLTGTVGSRDEKRAAEEIAEQSPGVREVQNHLRVSQEASTGQ